MHQATYAAPLSASSLPQTEQRTRGDEAEQADDWTMKQAEEEGSRNESERRLTADRAGDGEARRLIGEVKDHDGNGQEESKEAIIYAMNATIPGVERRFLSPQNANDEDAEDEMAGCERGRGGDLELGER